MEDGAGHPARMPWPRFARSVAVGAALGITLVAQAPPALAASARVQVLHSFAGSDGAAPYGALVQGSDGAFYGTTSAGGAGDAGTVFRITPAGVLTSLLAFDGANGRTPIAGLSLGSDGNFYGSTENGGSNQRGTVFRITTSGALTTLFHFDDSNGAFPRAAPTMSSDNRFFGVAGQGGSAGLGTVYRIATAGSATTLFSFDGAKGANPHAALVLGSDGNYYGTTESGGSSNQGTVFRITPTGTLTTLFSFDGTKGASPRAALLLAGDGNFYGTTQDGGANSAGTVFRMTSAGVVTTLASFGGANGSGPRAALVTGTDGNFYGTTFDTVFRVTPAGTLTTLHTFTGTAAGSPQSGLVRGADGALYGTTRDGGAAGKGTIFKVLLPAGAPTALSATAGGGSVSLSWSPSAAASSYSVYQADSSGAQGSTPVRTGVTTTSATIENLDSGTYFFTVTAVNENGESTPSNEARATVNVPDPFTFEALAGASPGTTPLSNIVTLGGLLADSRVAIAVRGDSGAAYSLNGDPFTTAAGTVANGDRVQLRVNAADTSGATTQATLDVGRVTGTFSVTTAQQDSTPDPFEFPAVGAAAPGSMVASSAVTIAGINTPASVTVVGDAGASYSINGGPFTSSAGQVGNGSSVRVRVQAAPQYNASRSVTLDVGGVSRTFSVDTGPDIAPDAFSFAPITGASPGQRLISTAVTISGIEASAPISVRGDRGSAYSVNGGAFTTAPGSIAAGDRVQVQLDAAHAAQATTRATLEVGGVSAAFTVTTAGGEGAGGGGALGAGWLLLVGGAALLRRRLRG